MQKPIPMKRSSSGSPAGLAELAARALAEDLGPGDPASEPFCGIPAVGRLLARQAGILSGTDIVAAVFRTLRPATRVHWALRPGAAFRAGQILGEVRAPLDVLLQGERTALNFLQRLSGVATVTRLYVDAARRNGVIYDTRKTTPLLRALQKRAVVHGGGRNHRMGLYDMVMLKNNHADAAGGIPDAVRRVYGTCPAPRRRPVPLCIEARTARDARDAADAAADIVMLDNMPPPRARRAIESLRTHCATRRLRTPLIEVSGGITLRNVARYAALPVDRISVGALTHSAPSLDIAFRIETRRR